LPCGFTVIRPGNRVNPFLKTCTGYNCNEKLRVVDATKYKVLIQTKIISKRERKKLKHDGPGSEGGQAGVSNAERREGQMLVRLRYDKYQG
jgi:hypothetical protein